MNNANHISEDELALFALALLPPQEAALTTAHLRHCPQCREEVARLQGDLAVLALTTELQAPPAAARERLLAAVAQESRHVPAELASEAVPAPVATPSARPLPAERSTRRGPGWFGWAGWAVAAGLAAAVGWQLHQGSDLRHQIVAQSNALDQAHRAQGDTAAESARAQQVLSTLTDPKAMQVALQLTANAAAAKPEGHAAYVADRGALVFIGMHLRPVAPGKTYELWLLPAAGTAPVAAGLFRPDASGNASVVLPDLPRNVAAKGFGVTVENDGGSTTPTPPILLAGT